MDKIFSTRLDESVVVELERVTRRHGMTKKKFLEDAIQSHARDLSGKEGLDIWSETFGAWSRKGTTVQTVDRARRTFRKNFSRHRS